MVSLDPAAPTPAAAAPEVRALPPLPGRAGELLLVALGAIPGAWLRWGLHCDPLANLLGCLLIGLVSGQRPARPRLMLLLGIGFCGALTTFSGWILALASALGQGPGPALLTLLLQLPVGLAAVLVGRLLARRRLRH
jgi:CrcB protein